MPDPDDWWTEMKWPTVCWLIVVAPFVIVALYADYLCSLVRKVVRKARPSN